VAVEDKDFYKHPGFSISGYGRALVQDVSSQEIKSGGSTITQQLVKNALLNSHQTLLRKYQELFLALEINRRYPKDTVLEMYLNTAYFGEGAYGIQDAAKTYFGKDAKDLDLAQSAMLAGILPAPSAYNPIDGDEDIALRRQRIVLDLMVAQGYITQDEATAALNEKLTYAKPQPDNLNQIGTHFALMVKDQLIEMYGEQKVNWIHFIHSTNQDWNYRCICMVRQKTNSPSCTTNITIKCSLTLGKNMYRKTIIHYRYMISHRFFIILIS
jgi:membrane peptidoglycan carboxypeptidase